MKPSLQAFKTGRSENEATSVGTLGLFQDKGKLISSHGQITTNRIPRPSHTCTRLYCVVVIASNGLNILPRLV